MRLTRTPPSKVALASTDRRRHHGRRPASALLLLIIAGTFSGAFLFELAVRTSVAVSDFFWQPDPVLGVRLAPDRRGRGVKPGLFDVSVATDSHGFRDREHRLEKPPGPRRVVLLGASYVEALQVPLEQSVTVLLEDRMRAAGLDVEIINLGVSAYGTGREYLMLREHGLRYRPDVVVLFLVGSDLLNNSQRLERLPHVPYSILNGRNDLARDSAGEPRFTPIPETASRLAPLTAALKDHSKAYRFTRACLEASPAIHALLYRAGLLNTPPQAAATEAAGATEFINLGLSGFGTGREYLMLREYGLRYKPDLVLLFFVGNDISDNSRRLQGKPFVPYPAAYQRLWRWRSEPGRISDWIRT